MYNKNHLNFAIVGRYFMLLSTWTERKIDTHTHTKHTHTHTHTHTTHTHTNAHPQIAREKEREKWTHTIGQIKAQFRWRPVQNMYSVKRTPRVQRKITED